MLAGESWENSPIKQKYIEFMFVSQKMSVVCIERVCDAQMQLLALTRQNTAVANSNHQLQSHNPAAQLMPVRPRTATEPVAPDRRSDNIVTADDHEGASLLDTPAPRRRPPVPTQYEPSTVAYQPVGRSHHSKPPLPQSGL